MFDLLIRGDRVVTPHGVGPWEIAVKDGVVAALGARGTFAAAQAERVIDAGGGIVMPGGIDPHVHCSWYMPAFRPGEPSGLSGPPEQVSRAALWGGTTTLIDFAACKPDREGDESSSQSLRDAIEARDRDFVGRCYCDYAYHVMLRGRVPASTIAELAEAVQAGYPTVKIFTTDITPSRRGRMIRFGELWEIFKVLARAGGLGVIHAEDDDIVMYMYEKLFAENRTGFEHMAEVHNTLSEDLSFRRIIRLAENVDGMALYMMHVSAAAGVQAIAESRARGFPIYGETLHQYLLYTSEDYRRPNGQIYHTYPSLKSKRDQDGLWDGVARGHLHCIATDEVCCKLAVKVQGARIDDTTGGNSGVEPRVAVMYTETVEKRGYSLEKFVDLVSTNAARILGLYPRKGAIAVGSDADITVLDTASAARCALGPARERLHALGGQGSRRVADADRAARQGHGRRRTVPRRPRATGSTSSAASRMTSGRGATRTTTAEHDDEGVLVPPVRWSRSPGLRGNREACAGGRRSGGASACGEHQPRGPRSPRRHLPHSGHLSAHPGTGVCGRGRCPRRQGGRAEGRRPRLGDLPAAVRQLRVLPERSRQPVRTRGLLRARPAGRLRRVRESADRQPQSAAVARRLRGRRREPDRVRDRLARAHQPGRAAARPERPHPGGGLRHRERRGPGGETGGGHRIRHREQRPETGARQGARRAPPHQLQHGKFRRAGPRADRRRRGGRGHGARGRRGVHP